MALFSHVPTVRWFMPMHHSVMVLRPRAPIFRAAARMSSGERPVMGATFSGV